MRPFVILGVANSTAKGLEEINNNVCQKYFSSSAKYNSYP